MEDAWIPSIDERFYGFPVRSAFCKQAGAGKQKVEWNTTLPQDGNYEVFFYYTARFTGSSSAQKEESHYYTVFDGQEEHEVIVDINTDEVGNWISLGVFDFSKNAKVTLSDRARTGDNAQPLVADAVKWVKR